MLKHTYSILLADDDAEDQEILKDALLTAESNLTVDSVFNGGVVITFLNACNDSRLPCLIVLDYKMPLLNAEEVLAILGGNARYKNIPKVVWSTSGQPEHIEKCINKGAARYFVKPASGAEARLVAGEMIKICKMHLKA